MWVNVDFNTGKETIQLDYIEPLVKYNFSARKSNYAGQHLNALLPHSVPFCLAIAGNWRTDLGEAGGGGGYITGDWRNTTGGGGDFWKML